MKYQKAKMIAKNLPTGSYAAGCPQYNTHDDAKGQPGLRGNACMQCQRAY
jgi:hypothetical protein